MSCTIKSNEVIEWEIDPEHITNLYTHLYDNNEVSGDFTICTKQKKTINSKKTMSGTQSTVSSPDAIVNWHSHPIQCYKTEETVWGWPSGEDIRETIIFCLRGSACHIIPSLEGTYVMQVNPCFIDYLINIDKYISDYSPNFLRGFIIQTIELYFKSTHYLRTTEFISKNQHITADDFIKLANAFKIQNIIKNSKVENCGSIKCNGVVNENNDIISFTDYIREYDDSDHIYEISKNGSTFVSKENYYDFYMSDGISILKKVLFSDKCSFNISKWHTERMFLFSLTHNIINGVDYFQLPFKKKWELIMNNGNGYDIRLKNNKIIFKMLDMSGKCNYSDIQKFVLKSNNIIMIGSPKCSYCVEHKKKHKIANFKCDYEMYVDVKTAILTAQKKYDKKIDSIPAYIVDGKYQPSFTFE